MGRQAVIPGGTIDALTAEEAVELLRATYREEVEERVRGAAIIALDATGGGVDEVYSPPLGFEFEARRVQVDLSTAADPASGNVALNAAGKTLEYLRSGTRIEWAQPQYGGAVQVPGVQTWGNEQGPYIRNGEVFEVRARGLTANATLVVTVEGILRRPAAGNDHGAVHRPPAGQEAGSRRGGHSGLMRDHAGRS
jgi:hypothetical protein